MKRMLSLLLLFLVSVSLTCLADSTDAAALFKSKCAMCHGPDGTGSTMGQKLGVKSYKSPDIQKQSNTDLQNSITNGKGKMPSYGKSLTPEQIAGLTKYIRELGK